MNLLRDSAVIDNTAVTYSLSRKLFGTNTIAEKEKVVMENLNQVHNLVAKRIEIGAKAALMAQLQNNSFYWHVIQGLVVGVFFSFYFLNF